MFALIFFLLSTSRATESHHSFSAEFEPDQQVTVMGTVTKLEWTNPHGRMFMEAKDASGTPVVWEFQLGSVNALMRNNGWTRDTLKAGTVLTAGGYKSRAGGNYASLATAVFPDGSKFFMPGAAPPGTPAPR